MSDQVNNDRRRFLRNSAITIAAAEFAMMSSASALPGAQPSKKNRAAGAPPREDRALQEELLGYSEYMGRTRYRLVPYVW
jgi:protein-S-isoprenylcysteine O-methyltransferase Ste14